MGDVVPFVNIVEKSSKLRFEDSRSSYVNLLEALGKLEAHGFDVRPVVDRVCKLLFVKIKSEQVQKKAKIDEEIDEILRKIEELKGKQSIALTSQVAYESETGQLRSEMEAIDEEMLQIQLKYKRHAAAFPLHFLGEWWSEQVNL